MINTPPATPEQAAETLRSFDWGVELAHDGAWIARSRRQDLLWLHGAALAGLLLLLLFRALPPLSAASYHPAHGAVLVLLLWGVLFDGTHVMGTYARSALARDATSRAGLPGPAALLLLLLGPALALVDARLFTPGPSVVGQAGLLLRSDDGGLTWRAELPATTRDLHAVRIAGDNSLVLAVGQAGTVVRIAQDDTSVTELLDASLSLRALHLSTSHGHAVGDDGVMFSTHDQGRSWEPIALGLETDLLGLDDLHGEPHL